MLYQRKRPSSSHIKDLRAVNPIQPLHSAFIMVFPILNLPTEVIDHIAERLPQEDIPRFALTCERLYKICVGYYYQTVVVASTRFDTNSLPLQKSGIKWMDRLSSDVNKRNGIRELIIHGIGVHRMYVHHVPTHGNAASHSCAHFRPMDAPDRVIPEPFLTEFRKERMEWNKLQPVFLRKVESFLFGNFDFPRLQTFFFDVGGLTTEVDAHRFLAFLKRHPHIQNVIVEGYPQKTFTFLRTPRAVDLNRLRRLSIYGPLLPLLIGYPFALAPSAGKHEPLAARTVDHKLPLTRVHIWWPHQRMVHACHVGNAVELDPIHVLKALARVSKDALRSLQIDLAAPQLDVELIEFVTVNFPNLRELNICSMEQSYLTGQVRLIFECVNTIE